MDARKFSDPIAKPRTQIIGAQLNIDLSQLYGLVNTAERLGDLVDSHKYQELTDTFLDGDQAQRELEAFYDVARSCGDIISRHLKGEGEDG
jgi:hypothetical protein